MKARHLYTLLMLFWSISSSFGQLTGWSYKQLLFIANKDTTDLSNFQVKLILNTSVPVLASKMKSNGSDIRFTDSTGNKLLSHWIEKGMNTTQTIVWLKLPFLKKNSTQKVILYYGNSSALSTESGDSTFVFFDTFSDSASSSSKWTMGKDATVTRSFKNDKAVFNGSGYATITSGNLGITAPFMVHTNMNGKSAYSWDLCPVGIARDNGDFYRIHLFSGIAYRFGNGFTTNGSPGTISSSTVFTTTSCDSFYDFVTKVNADGSMLISHSFPNGDITIPSNNSVSNATRVSLGYYYNPGNATGYCTNGREYQTIFVRKFAATQPTLDSIGAEIILPFLGINDANIPAAFNVYPNPSYGDLHIIFEHLTSGELILTDLSGRKILSNKIKNESAAVIPVGELNAGVYFIQVFSNGYLTTKKILKY